MNDERSKFEVHAGNRALRLDRDDGESYRYIQTDEAWEAWQARASQSDGTSGGAKTCLFAQTADLMRAIDAYAYDYREFGKLAPSRHTVQIAIYDALNKFQGENHVG